MKKLLLFLIVSLLLVATQGEQQVGNVLSNANKPIARSSPSHDHPFVQYHQTLWYKNWMTCTICNAWVTTFQTLASKS